MSHATTLSEALVDRWPAITVTLLACLAVFLPRYLRVFRMLTFPTVGKEIGNAEKRRQAYLQGARKLYYDGYQKVRTVKSPRVQLKCFAD